jgi:uncharacterized membrane protein
MFYNNPLQEEAAHPVQKGYVLLPHGKEKKIMNINKNILAAVAYFTWIGFFIAYAMGDKNDPFMRHHLNQALVIDLAGLIGGVFAVIPLLGALVAGVVNIAGFVLDIMGAISAYQGSRASLPIIGDIHIIG